MTPGSAGGPGPAWMITRNMSSGADLVSFDVYPVAGLDRPDGAEYLWYVPKGVDRLVKWTGGQKLVWNCIECTRIHNPKRKATPAQVRSEVWMALIHGSRGLIYFVHQFAPKFNEHALLDDPEMLAGVTAINRQIRELAPVLNSPTIPDGASVRSSAPDVPIDLMVKRRPEAVYVFAVGMRNKPSRGSFRVEACPPRRRPAFSAKTARSRSGKGQFADDFPAYGVHLYRITADQGRADDAGPPRSEASVIDRNRRRSQPSRRAVLA